MTLRHEACYYGKPACVDVLCARDELKVNGVDPLNGNITPWFLCHMTGTRTLIHSIELNLTELQLTYHH